MTSTINCKLPAPWHVVQIPGGYKVVDAAGMALAYCYGKDPREASSTVGDLSWDEARRVAANIARLPELLRRDIP